MYPSTTASSFIFNSKYVLYFHISDHVVNREIYCAANRRWCNNIPAFNSVFKTGTWIDNKSSKNCEPVLVWEGRTKPLGSGSASFIFKHEIDTAGYKNNTEAGEVHRKNGSRANKLLKLMKPDTRNSTLCVSVYRTRCCLGVKVGLHIEFWSNYRI